MKTHITMARIMALAFCMAPNTEAGTAGGSSEEVKTAAEVQAEGVKKEKNLIPDIIRGRMPVAVVFLARFGDQRNLSTKDAATLFGTTVGKIDDIKKNRNFGYVKADYVPTQEQKDEGIAWLQRHVKYNDGVVDKLINELEALPVASAEEAAKFATARTEARGHNSAVTTKEGEVANGGGGNRVKSGKKAKEAPVETAPAETASADELLA